MAPTAIAETIIFITKEFLYEVSICLPETNSK